MVILITVSLALAAGVSPCAGAQEQAAYPAFQEVLDVIKQHLPRSSEAELNRAAVEALVSSLSPRVLLLSRESDRVVPQATLITRTNSFEEGIAYLRVGVVSAGLAEAIRDAIGSVSRGGRPKGLVLDLRYTGGEDYAAAAAATDLFVKSERPLLNWGSGSARSANSGTDYDFPVAVLINRSTSQAAEALAGVLRETGTGLLLGSATAGKALVYRDFPLRTGDRLRIAVGQVQLGDGSELPAQGVKPDIAVEVTAAQENAYYADAFRLAGASTNLSDTAGTNPIRRLPRNEADLIREHREGQRSDSPQVSQRRTEPDRPVVHDPALARALDLLKGLAVVRQARS